VLRALGAIKRPLTVVVSIAYEGERGDNPEQRLKGEGVGDLRRSLEALSREPGPLVRALRRPLTIERLGRHPLGNLAIASAAAALGDYGEASTWLGEQLGIEATVLPATTEPVRREIERVPGSGPDEAGGPGRPLSMLRFVGVAIQSPRQAIAAVEQAELVLLAPGDLYRSVLATAAVPDIAAALRRTSARVVWIANLEPDPDERGNPTAMDHLELIRSHDVRIDAVLHDPSAALTCDPAELERSRVELVSRPLRSTRSRATHDPQKLGSALGALIEAASTRGRAGAHDAPGSAPIRRR
jgi:uncharacterized cofD-like protein